MPKETGEKKINIKPVILNLPTHCIAKFECSTAQFIIYGFMVKTAQISVENDNQASVCELIFISLISHFFYARLISLLRSRFVIL